MGNSPSRSTSSEYLEGTNSHHPEGNTGQRLPFNPFDFQGDDNHSRRVNFPLFSDAMMQTEDPDSGPSIDTLASMYPIDFPLRFPERHAETEVLACEGRGAQRDLDRWFTQLELRKAIQGDSPTPSCNWSLEGIPYREGAATSEQLPLQPGPIFWPNLRQRPESGQQQPVTHSYSHGVQQQPGLHGPCDDEKQEPGHSEPAISGGNSLQSLEALRSSREAVGQIDGSKTSVMEVSPSGVRSFGRFNLVAGSDDGGEDVELATSSIGEVASPRGSDGTELLSSGRLSSVDKAELTVHPGPAPVAWPSFVELQQQVDGGSSSVAIQCQSASDGSILPFTSQTYDAALAEPQLLLRVQGSLRSPDKERSLSDHDMGLPGDDREALPIINLQSEQRDHPQSNTYDASIHDPHEIRPPPPCQPSSSSSADFSSVDRLDLLEGMPHGSGDGGPPPPPQPLDTEMDDLWAAVDGENPASSPAGDAYYPRTQFAPVLVAQTGSSRDRTHGPEANKPSNVPTLEPSQGQELGNVHCSARRESPDICVLSSADVSASPKREVIKRPPEFETLGVHARQRREGPNSSQPLEDFLRADASFLSSSTESLFDGDRAAGPSSRHAHASSSTLPGVSHFPDRSDCMAPSPAAVMVLPAAGITLQLDASALQELMRQCAQLAADSAIAAVRGASDAARKVAPAASASHTSKSIGVQTQSPPKDQCNQTDDNLDRLEPHLAASQTPIIPRSTSYMPLQPVPHPELIREGEAVTAPLGSSSGPVTPSKSFVAPANENRPLHPAGPGPSHIMSIPEAGPGPEASVAYVETLMELPRASWEAETVGRSIHDAMAFTAPASAYAKPKNFPPLSNGSSPSRPPWASASLHVPPSTVGYSPGPEEGIASLRSRSAAPGGGAARSLDVSLHVAQERILRESGNTRFPPPSLGMSDRNKLIDSGSWKRHLGANLDPGMGDELPGGVKRQKGLNKENMYSLGSSGIAPYPSSNMAINSVPKTAPGQGELMRFMPPSMQQRIISDGQRAGIISNYPSGAARPGLSMLPPPLPPISMGIRGGTETTSNHLLGGANRSTWILPEAQSLIKGKPSQGAMMDHQQHQDFIIPQRLLPPSLQQQWQSLNASMHQLPGHQPTPGGFKDIGMTPTPRMHEDSQWIVSNTNSPSSSFAASNDFMDVVADEVPV